MWDIDIGFESVALQPFHTEFFARVVFVKLSKFETRNQPLPPCVSNGMCRCMISGPFMIRRCT